MSENSKVKFERSIFTEIFYKLKENLILILIIVIMAGGLGVVYDKLQKPIYTGSQEVNYRAEYSYDKDNVNDKHHPSQDNYVQNCINIMRVYVNTMVDFCTTGVVLDRAEYYFSKFVESNLLIDDFMLRVKNGDYDEGYDANAINERIYFNDNTVSATLVKYEEETFDSFKFLIKCTNGNSKIAKQMTRIFAVAIDVEGRDYFKGVNTYVSELLTSVDGVAVYTEKSTTKTVVIFLAAGVLLSLIIVYVKTLLDNTAKDKEEIEAMTGIDVLAYIENQETYHVENSKKTKNKGKKGE